jgi:hypothetical protein
MNPDAFGLHVKVKGQPKTTCRAMSGDMVRRPHTDGEWWILVCASDSLEFSGSWCRRIGVSYDIRPSVTRFPQDANWSTLAMIKEAL